MPPTKARYSKGLRSLKGFTLAEVLITLSIIGVVAAMTIPTLMTKHQKQTYVVGLKKAYATLSNAVSMIPISEGCSAGDFECAGMPTTGNWETQSSDEIYRGWIEILSKQFKVAKLDLDCSSEECNVIKYGNATDNHFVHSAFVTQDGMIFASYEASGYVLGVWVDVNGTKGPNQIGRDQFAFTVQDKISDMYPDIPVGKVSPVGLGYYSACTAESIDNDSGLTCTARVLAENAMNY